LSDAEVIRFIAPMVGAILVGYAVLLFLMR
jgi:hypothetical protein